VTAKLFNTVHIHHLWETIMSDTQEVMVDVNEGVMTITMNRPEAKNAMNKSMAEGISAAIDEFEANADIRVAVLAGNGGTFCSGMDLKGFLKGESPSVKDRGFGGISHYSPAKPLIAATEGYALAGGFELVLSCDMVVAARTTKFGLPEVKRSLVAGAGGVFRLPQQIPERIAMEMVMTGDHYSAERMYECGLVNALTDEGKALDGAKELAARIAINGPLATAASKKIMKEYKTWPHDEIWARQQEIMNPVFSSEDAREGATAFAEKRAPNWQGK
jgi:enoyl-CoA hydratase